MKENILRSIGGQSGGPRGADSASGSLPRDQVSLSLRDHIGSGHGPSRDAEGLAPGSLWRQQGAGGDQAGVDELDDRRRQRIREGALPATGPGGWPAVVPRSQWTWSEPRIVTPADRTNSSHWHDQSVGGVQSRRPARARQLAPDGPSLGFCLELASLVATQVNMATVGVLGTFDTKGDDYAWVKPSA